MEHVKVNFLLEEGLEMESEGMWALRVGRKTCEIDNVPFYFGGIAVGDHVVAEKEAGLLWAKKLVKDGGHATIWIQSQKSDDVAAEQDLVSISEALRAKEVYSELEDELLRLVVDAEDNADTRALIRYLQEMEDDGRIEYAVMKTTDWLDAVLEELGVLPRAEE